jgi:Fic family protein
MSWYNFDLFPSLPTDLFTDYEQKVLNAATTEHEKKTKSLSPTIQKKELERLIIELSWKSSRIEGNTYTLLDTEKLILEHKEAPGHDRQEAKMILNHKDAFEFIHSRPEQFKTLTKRNLEELHRIVVDGLGVGFGLRSKPVGVLGSKYRPLDNVYQIGEAVEALSASVAKMPDAYTKALIALLGISYVQPFEDGNKRTARLMANALLLAHHRAPLSYRSVSEEEYREATLVFYELNSLMPFKKIFVNQYDFAARNYAVR